MRKILRLKNAQVALFFPSLFGFLIIFFILSLLFAVSLFLAAKNGISTDRIRPDSERANLNSAVMLSSLMNTKIEFEGEEISIEELIGRWASGKKEIKEKIEEEAGEILGKMPCYFFYSEYGLEHLRNNPGLYSGRGAQWTGNFIEEHIIEISRLTSANKESQAKQRNYMLNNATDFNIITDDNKINVKLYLC